MTPYDIFAEQVKLEELINEYKFLKKMSDEK